MSFIKKTYSDCTSRICYVIFYDFCCNSLTHWSCTLLTGRRQRWMQFECKFPSKFPICLLFLSLFERNRIRRADYWGPATHFTIFESIRTESNHAQSFVGRLKIPFKAVFGPARAQERLWKEKIYQRTNWLAERWFKFGLPCFDCRRSNWLPG